MEFAALKKPSLVHQYGEKGADAYLIDQAKKDGANPVQELSGGEIPPRSLLVLVYGSEIAADAYLVERAKQDAANPRKQLCGGNVPSKQFLAFLYRSEDAADAYLVEIARQASRGEEKPTGTLEDDKNDSSKLSESLNLPKSVKHKSISRAHELTSEIAEAKRRALNQNDTHSVWAELVKMAESKEGCLLGVEDDELRYQARENVDFFKKKNLRHRLRRAR
jgi:hypothetical protein